MGIIIIAFLHTCLRYGRTAWIYRTEETGIYLILCEVDACR